MSFENDTYYDFTYNDADKPFLHRWNYIINQETTLEIGRKGEISKEYTKLLEKQGIYYHGYFLYHENDQLSVINLYTGNRIGSPIPFLGDSQHFKYQTYYRFRKKNSDIIIIRRANMYCGNYNTGNLIELYQFPSGVLSFDINPINNSTIAIATEDSTLWLYDMVKEKILYSKKFQNAFNVSYSYDGKRILAYGKDVKLLNSYNLNTVDSISAQDLNLNQNTATPIQSVTFDETGSMMQISDGLTQSIWHYCKPNQDDYELISSNGCYSIKVKNKKYILWNNIINAREGRWEMPIENRNVKCFSDDNRYFVFYEFSKDSIAPWNYKIYDIIDQTTKSIVKVKESYGRDNIVLTKTHHI